VVASRIGGLQYSMVDGESGLLAEPGDAADLADKIGRVWRDAELARRLGHAARLHAERHFGHATHFDKLMQVYAEALAEAGATAGLPGQRADPPP